MCVLIPEDFGPIQNPRRSGIRNSPACKAQQSHIQRLHCGSATQR